MPPQEQPACQSNITAGYGCAPTLLWDAGHFLWLGGGGAASPPFEEVGPAQIFEAASAGEHSVGSRLRPTASGFFEPVPKDAIAGAFHDAGSDRQTARPVEVAEHSVPVGLAGADAGCDGFGPVVMRLQVCDDSGDLFGATACMAVDASDRCGRVRNAENRIHASGSGREAENLKLNLGIPDRNCRTIRYTTSRMPSSACAQAWRPPFAGLRKPRPGQIHAEPLQP